VSSVRYELGFYIPEDDILHSHSRENFKSYILILFVYHFNIWKENTRWKGVTLICIAFDVMSFFEESANCIDFS
jgi:hypothetical protein